MTERPKRVITLSDDPASSDAFGVGGDLGPHERVAKAIAEAIQDDPDVRGKMIGVIGRQGGGKSTVVEMLKGRLQSSKGWHLVIFNAWAHQGDPLRRAFLETLIDELQVEHDGEQWLEDTLVDSNITKWDGVKLDLASRRRVEETLTTPQPTRYGKYLVIAALCVPIGIPLLVRGLERWVAPSTDAAVNWSLIFGIALAVAPLLTVLANLVGLFGKGDWSWFKAASVTLSIDHTQAVGWFVPKG